jgi:hypothetical protein
MAKYEKLELFITEIHAQTSYRHGVTELISLPIPCHVHWQRSYCNTASICRKLCFRDQPCVHATPETEFALFQGCGACILGPCLHAGCNRAAWLGSWSRGNAMGAGELCLAPLVGYLTRVNYDFATVHATGHQYGQVLCSKSRRGCSREVIITTRLGNF